MMVLVLVLYWAARSPQPCHCQSVPTALQFCTEPYRAQGCDGASTVPLYELYREQARDSASTVPSHTQSGAVPGHAYPEHPLYRTAPARGRVPVVPPFPCRCRSRPVGAEPPVAGAAPGSSSSKSSPGSVELAAARRRLVAAEGRRRAAAELEGRVLQVHCALRHAELRLAARAEALGRLGAGVAQAQLALAAHTQRLQKGLRRRPRPRPGALLAAARALRSCVPWAPARARGAAAPPAAARRLPAAPRSPA
ncbi:TMF-regulated nuclear protein 1 [Pezoporus wallicus]|uniref:TMF-regulated nuclear protein 1 n=1 Tax=Pezoporus wallicus TaxID=35540 RepID=UPI002551B753|nr:TMF-regulated nuclear protein 1 [Pezoporus wallicus]